MQATVATHQPAKARVVSVRCDQLIHNVPVRDLIPNREVVTLVWYDPRCTDASAPDIDKLRRLNNYILYYTDESMCVDYLTSKMNRHEHVVVVLDHGANILDKALKCEQVRAVLLVDSSVANPLDNIDQAPLKIVAVFGKCDTMLVRLEKVIVDVEHQANHHLDGFFTSFDQKEKSLRDLQLYMGPSIWYQLFKAMAKKMPNSADAQREMLDECRSYYHTKPLQLAKIDEFERDYKPADAILWYSKPSFIHASINKALRTEDIMVLHAFRYFINDLSASLQEVNKDGLPTRVFRGAPLSRDEVENCHAGQLVATNGFLSTTSDLEVARIFGGFHASTDEFAKRSRDNPLQFAIFEIDIDPTHSSTVVMADISRWSGISDEGEILFDIGSTFEIVSAAYNDEHRLWNIHMKVSSKLAPIYQEYACYIAKLMEETHVDVLFGIILTDMGEYSKALEYCDRLLIKMSSDRQNQGNIYYSKARVYRIQGDYALALEHFRRAEALLNQHLPKSNSDLARTLAGIGSVYAELFEYEQELLYYERAMAIYETILHRDHIEVARSLNRLGFAHIHQRHYEQAEKYLNESLDIYRRIAPPCHPSVAQILCNLAEVHHALGASDRALDLLYEALDHVGQRLPEDHLHITTSCHQLSVVYEACGKLDLALEFAQRTLRIRAQKLPAEHQLVRETQQAVTRLQGPLRLNDIDVLTS